MVHIHRPSEHRSSPGNCHATCGHSLGIWRCHANCGPRNADVFESLPESRKRAIAEFLDPETYVKKYEPPSRRRRVTVFTKSRKDSRGKPTVSKGDTTVSKRRVRIPVAPAVRAVRDIPAAPAVRDIPAAPAAPARLNAVEEPMFVIDTKPAQTRKESWREREERLLKETLAARQGLLESHNEHANAELPTSQARGPSMDPEDVIYFDSGAAENAPALPTVRSEPTLSEIRAGLRAAKLLAHSAIRGDSPSPKPEYSSSPRLGDIPALDHDTLSLQSPETSEFELDDGMYSDSASEYQSAEEPPLPSVEEAGSGGEDVATLREELKAARNAMACHREYINLLERRILHFDPQYPFGFPLGNSEPATKQQLRDVRRILNNAYPLPPLQQAPHPTK